MKAFNKQQKGAIIFGKGMNVNEWVRLAKAQGYTVRYDGWNGKRWTFATLWK